MHVVVVDPGVGSARRPILMEAAGQRFVAPDNGVLAMVFAREKHKVRLISNERYFRHPVSQTFHGRDIFAPVAAHIASGVAPARIGKAIADYVRPPFEHPRQTGPHTWKGEILKIDRFGNVITNFSAEEFPGDGADVHRAGEGTPRGAQLRGSEARRVGGDRGQFGVPGGIAQSGLGRGEDRVSARRRVSDSRVERDTSCRVSFSLPRRAWLARFSYN